MLVIACVSCLDLPSAWCFFPAKLRPSAAPYEMASLVNKCDGAAKLHSAGSGSVILGTAIMLLVYLASSSLMTVLNSHAKKHFNFPFSLLCLQNGTTVVFIILAGLLGLAKVEKLQFDFAKKWIPVSVAFVVMIWTSLEAGNLVGLPATTALRNATTLFVVLSDYFILKSRISGQCMFWLVFMFLSMIWFYQGAVGAVETDSSSTSSASNFFRGILFLSMNVVATVVNHIYAKSVMNNTAVDGFTIALYNNLLSLIALIPLAVYNETSYFASASNNGSAVGSSISSGYSGYFLVALSSVLASVLAVSSYLVQKRVQVTSFSVASNSSKILAIIVNHYWPAKTEIWNINKLSGLISTLFCAFMYTWEKTTKTSEDSRTLAKFIFPALFVGACALCMNGALQLPHFLTL